MKGQREFLRSSIFGFEDALVSTAGVVIGISAGTTSKEFVLLAGIVTIAVEAVSMAAGEYLTARTVQEAYRKEKVNPGISSVIMFVSYFLGGIVPLIPVLFFSSYSLLMVIIFAGTGLFTLGYIKGWIVHVSPTRSAMEMLVVGGVAAAIGVAAGYLLRTY